MNKLIWPLLAMLAGTFLPLQAGLNTKLGKGIESPVYASLISFVVGAIGLAIYVALTGQPVNFINARSITPAAWLGGLLGAFYVTVIIFAFPRIGPGLTFGLVIAGQMLMSVTLEHFNALVAAQHPINVWRICGVILIIGGVILIRKF